MSLSVKISVVLGTRPEAIKMAPVILALKADPALECHVCSTGQHRHMLDQVFEVFGIQPDVDLDLMRPNQTLGELTARAIKKLDEYMLSIKPAMVLVQGDTTTVFAATLSAFYHKIPVGHVEAGLRTWNLQSPWPEEANRVLTTRLAALHFAPTETNRQNLIREGVPNERIHVTGNTVIDALLLTLEKVGKTPPRVPGLPEFLQPSPTSSLPLVLITGHRRENFGHGFEEICRAISELARRFPEVHFVYPVHLNPNVRKPVQRILGANGHDTRPGDRRNIHLIEPVAYLPFVALMSAATLILTDSGGVQEEAPSLGKPVLVMRDNTERPEALQPGCVKLVGTNKDLIVAEAAQLLNSGRSQPRATWASSPYGDGRAAPRILDACKRFLVL